MYTEKKDLDLTMPDYLVVSEFVVCICKIFNCNALLFNCFPSVFALSR